jgi:hypothetical protein
MLKRCSNTLEFTAAAIFGLLINAPLGFAGELFHSGAAGKCEECHSIGQQDAGFSGQSVGSNGSGSLSLRGSDASSTCLRCHEAPASVQQPQGHYVATTQAAILSSAPPIQLTPGGDFGWLKKTYRWQGEGGYSSGDRHGHNIVALDFNYVADTSLQTAPGGSYPAGSLSCISCHDPHGNYRRDASGEISSSGLPITASGSYSNSPDPSMSGSVGSYRMLAGKGYQPKSQPAATVFTADSPAAMAPASYNRAEQVNDTRVAYGSGMSEWCQNCHSQIHNDGTAGGSGHPAGNNARFSQSTMNNYSYYVKSGDLNGRSDNSYTSMVPYEMGTKDYGLLKATANSDGSNLRGPGTGGENPNVMCLTCHRAHASGWDSMMRWNNQSTFIVINDRYPGIDNGASPAYAQGRTEAETRKTFYDRPANRYASYQRSLCNKCHAQD